jgi:hypothetical protein
LGLYKDAEYLTKEALDGFGISIVVGKVTCCVKYVDDPVLLLKEKVLQGIIDSINETERCYGMEMNVHNLR